jgi:pimeloyl-ACP methyl ester carboxylesterase
VDGIMNEKAIHNHSLPLVLLGGTLCNGRLWLPMLETLNASHVISITLEGADSTESFAQQLLSTLPPRFCVVGFSLGAMVALQMLADAPQRIAGMALLSVNPLADDPNNAPSRREAVKEARRQGLATWLTATMWPRYVAPAHLEREALHRTLVQMAEESGVETFAKQTEVAISRQDKRAALATFTAPTLIINGAHDPICTPHHHQLAAEAAACAQQITFSDCGHFLPLEAPERLASSLRNWLKEIIT